MLNLVRGSYHGFPEKQMHVKVVGLSLCEALSEGLLTFTAEINTALE